jgi:hypothetical protein
MKDKPEQMSGFKHGKSPQDIYEMFIQQLQQQYPGALQAVQSLTPANRKKKTKASVWSQINSLEDEAIVGGDMKPPVSTTFSFGFQVDLDD